MTPAVPQDHLDGPQRGLVLLVAATALYHLATTTASNDLWGYLAFGRLFWDTGRFPYQDVFAYTPTLHPWVYHEWLTGVILFPLYRLAGGAGLQVLKYGLGLATLYLVYLIAQLQQARAYLTFSVLLAISPLLTLSYSPVRAQVFTYFCFALTLYLLEGARQLGRWRLLWLLLPLLALWGNLHGGFAAGLGLMAIYGMGERLNRQPYRPYLLALLGAGLATLINPYGWTYWIYLQRAVMMPRPSILEWASLPQYYQAGLMPGLQVLLLASLTIMVVTLAWRTRWRDYTGWLTLGVTFYLCLTHVRHLMFYLLALGLYAPLLLTGFSQKLGPLAFLSGLDQRLKRNVVMILCACLTILGAYQFIRVQPLALKTPDCREEGGYYPVAAVDYVKRQKLTGKILTDFNWGQYLIWHLYPACRVAFDGRYETVYPQEVEEAYALFMDGLPGWTNFLVQYPPDLILIAKKSRPYHLLQAEPEWREIYADPGVAILARRDFAPALTPEVWP